MSLTLTCRCGRKLKVDESVVGHSIRCRCGRVLRVRGAKRAGVAHEARHLLRRVRSWARTPVRDGARRSLWRASLTWCVAAIIAWPFLHGLGDRWWPATVLLFGPRWVLLLPLVLLVPLALVILPRALVPLLGGGVVLAGPVMGFAAGGITAPRRAAELRVVTFNIQGGSALGVPGTLETALATWEADIVALQECSDAAAEEVRALDAVATHTHGNLCLISRFPIVAVDSLPPWRIGELGWAGAVVGYTIDAGGRRLRVTNLHLDTPGRGLEMLRERRDSRLLAANLEMREVASRRASNWVIQSGTPALVAGDFNTPQESAIFRRYWGHLDDAFAGAGLGYGGTRVLRWFRVRIDHILTSGDLRAVRAEVGADLGSDHLPLIADFIWNDDE
jgi:endonuclease/exonuclease/phosphatase (EEP) superfamily protein YafD